MRFVFLNSDKEIFDVNKIEATKLSCTIFKIESLGLLQAPIQRVLGALENKDNAKKEEAVAEAAPVVSEVAAAPEAPVVEAAPEVEATPEAPVVEAAPEAPSAEAEATPEA